MAEDKPVFGGVLPPKLVPLMSNLFMVVVVLLSFWLFGTDVTKIEDKLNTTEQKLANVEKETMAIKGILGEKLTTMPPAK